MKKLHQRRQSVLLGFMVPVLGLLTGIYALVTVLAPYGAELPIIRQRSVRAVEQKLQASSSINGDRLYIPQIGVDVAIATGDDVSALENGAWHRKPENGDPARGGNFVLSAHRFQMGWTPLQTALKSPFYHIDKLVVGDKLHVDYRAVRYTYEVTRTYSVEPYQTEIESASQEAKLTLYSCSLRGAADGRNVIEAVRTNNI